MADLGASGPAEQGTNYLPSNRAKSFFTHPIALPLTTSHHLFIVSGNGEGMTDQGKQKSPLSAAERQRLFKERQRGAGFRHTTVWIHTETEEEGKQAARDGKPLKPMESKDPLSWAAGWIAEKGKQ
jgi:hypothetical protein